MAEAGDESSASHSKGPRVPRSGHPRGCPARVPALASPVLRSALLSPPRGAPRAASRGARTVLRSQAPLLLRFPPPPSRQLRPNPEPGRHRPAPPALPSLWARAPTRTWPRAPTRDHVRAPRPAPRRALPGGEPRVGAAALLGDWRQPEPPRGRRPHHGLSPSAPRESVRPGRRAPPGTRAGTRGPGHARTHVRGTPSPTAALACGKSRAAVAAGPQGAPRRPFRRRRDRWGVRRGRDGSPAAGSPEGVRGRARLGGAGHPNWLGLGGQTAGTHPGHPAKGYSLWSVLETKVKLKPSLG